MTLAATILLFSVFSLTSTDPGLVAQAAAQSEPSSTAPTSKQQAPSAQATPNSGKPSSAQSADTQAPSKPKPTGQKTRRRKKAVTSTGCDTAATNASALSSSSSPAPAGTAQNSSAAAPAPPKNCPPQKVIVRQGGISEESIQLAGGSATDETTQKRDTINQMLGATDGNLKKISGQQLREDQQSAVSQIREFMHQSKSAIAAGDLERAQTLAWKAKLLSDDLVNTKK